MPTLKKQILSDTDDLHFEIIKYQKAGTWQALPEWARFFLKLGEELSQFSIKNRRFVVALSLPTRSFASVLIASGISCGRSKIISHTEDNDYFDLLKALKDGTPVIYRDGTKKIKGRKHGVMQYDEKFLLGIQIDQGFTNTIIYKSIEHARSIEVIDADEILLPKQQKGREISVSNPLVRKILGDKRGTDFSLQTKLENVIVGPVNILQQELETIISAQDEIPGQIADLVRAREFLPKGSAYRSFVFPSVSNQSPKLTRNETPHVVIFDSAMSFIKHREAFRQFNWLVLLDRTDRNFEYAVSQVNDEFYYREDEQSPFKIPEITTGIEMMLFLVNL